MTEILLPDFGVWVEKHGEMSTHGGSSSVTMSQMGSSDFYGWKAAVGQGAFATILIGHDVMPGSVFLLRARCTTSGTSVNPVRWRFRYTIAGGFDTANYNVTGTVLTADVIPSGTAWRHLVAETVTISSAELKPGAVIRVACDRVASGAAENSDSVFLDALSVVYQADRLGTHANAPDFYI